MGEQIRTQYDYWCDHHTDTPLVSQAWKRFETCVNSNLDKRMMPEFQERLQEYLRQLEFQAFRGGISSGILLVMECIT